VSPRRAPDFRKVALRLAEIIGSDECRLVGGLAVAAHGYIRATRDVDLVARPSLPEVKRRLLAGGVEATLFRGDVLEGDFPCLRGVLEGVPFDVLPELVPVDWESGSVVLRGQAANLRVVSLEALLAFKMKAQGPRDLMDAAMLVLLHPESRSVALDLARSYRVADRLGQWLEDPRLAREARDLQASELRASRKPRKPKRLKRTS
jgi:hypothetical protein